MNPNRKKRSRPASAGPTYEEAGVDLQSSEAMVPRLKALARLARRPEVEGEIGGFGGCFRVPSGYRQPVLVAGMDGVGTKLDLLIQTGRHETAGRDLVAMCVNDVLAQGAEPLFFLDYVATGKLDAAVVEEIVAGVAAACAESGCALIGGETAEMPGFYPSGRYDLAGCAVGIVEQERIVDGRAVRPGDVLLGLASSGPHSNGFSLIREILRRNRINLTTVLVEGSGQVLADAALAPTRLYVRPVLQVLERIPIHGIAHITGGGIAGNLGRVIPDGCRAIVKESAWPRPPLFSFLMKSGSVSPTEMNAVFNMGLGLILVVGPGEAGPAQELLQELGEEVFRIGHVEASSGRKNRVLVQGGDA